MIACENVWKLVEVKHTKKNGGWGANLGQTGQNRAGN